MGLKTLFRSFSIILVLLLTVGSRAHVTRPEHAFITLAPDVSAAWDLKRRDSGTICAYFSGDPNSPLSCPGTSVCTYVGASWGCCDALACSTPAVCEGFGKPYCGGVGSANCVYSQIQQCTDAASPDCVKYIRETGPADDAKKTSWGCAATSTTIVVLAEVTGAVTGAAASSTPNNDNPASSVSSAGDVPSSLASSTSPPSSDTTSAPSEASSSASSGLSISDKIALGVGIPAAVAAVIGIPYAIIKLVKLMRARNAGP